MSKDNMPDSIVAKDFRSLIIYRKAVSLTKLVYEVVKSLPADELYNISNQMKRAICSVSANVAEGRSNLYNRKELTHISTAIGSAGEMRCWYDHCLNLNYITKEQYDKLDADTEEVIKLLVGYAKKLKRDIES